MTPQGAEATLSIGYLESGLTGFMAYDLQQVWSKAELVVSVSGSVVSFPNHEDRVVVLESGNSYTVTSGKPNSSHMYTCEKKCVNFKRSLHFCEHTLAAAETAGHLEEYLAVIQLEKSRETLQSVIERSRNQNAGEKSKKNRKGRNNTQSRLIIQQIPLYTAEYHNDTPFEIRFMDAKFKSCASCGIDFPHKYNSGQDLVVSHKERYTFPSKKEQGKQLWEYTKKNTRDVAYHCSTDCLMKLHPYFTKQRLVMKREVFESLSEAQKQHLESSMDLVLDLHLILDE